jgi:hypothetical protein
MVYFSAKRFNLLLILAALTLVMSSIVIHAHFSYQNGYRDCSMWQKISKNISEFVHMIKSKMACIRNIRKMSGSGQIHQVNVKEANILEQVPDQQKNDSHNPVYMAAFLNRVFLLFTTIAIIAVMIETHVAGDNSK